MEIRALREDDDRSAFRSGDPDLDRFFHTYAGQNQFRRHIGASYVAVDGGVIQGFATVVPGHLEIDEAPAFLRKNLPRYPVPILRLARLAVQASAQGRGLGTALLRFVLRLALRMATDYGCAAVVVDAKPAAVEFYTGFGFTRLEPVAGQAGPRSAALLLSMADIADAVDGHRHLEP